MNLQSAMIRGLIKDDKSSLALQTAAQLGVFTSLAKGLTTVEEVAQDIDADPVKLGRLIRVLVIVKLLRMNGDALCNAKEAEEFLVEGGPHYIAQELSFPKDVTDMALSVRTGVPQNKLDWNRPLDEYSRISLLELDAGARAAARALVEREPIFSSDGAKSLIDVGGGTGAFCAEIIKSCPQIETTVAELPSTASFALQQLKEGGMDERVKVLKTNVITDRLEGQYNIAVMRLFLQVLSSEDARRVIQKVSRIIRPGGVLYVIGRVLDDSPSSVISSAWWDFFAVDTFPDAQVHSEREYRTWFEGARLTVREKMDLTGEHVLFVVTRP